MSLFGKNKKKSAPRPASELGDPVLDNIPASPAPEDDEISPEEFIAEEFAGSENEEPEESAPVQRNVFAMGPAPSEVSLPDGEPELDDQIREALEESNSADSAQAEIPAVEEDEVFAELPFGDSASTSELDWPGDGPKVTEPPKTEEESAEGASEPGPESSDSTGPEEIDWLAEAPDHVLEHVPEDEDHDVEVPDVSGSTKGKIDDEELSAQYKELTRERHLEELRKERGQDSIRLVDESEERESEAEAEHEIADRLAEAASGQPDSEEVKALLALIEERAEHLQAEKDRLATMRSLAEMEISRAEEQVAELEAARESLEKDRVSLQETRRSIEAVRDSINAEQERVQTELVEASKARVSANEREARARRELEKAEEARDSAQEMRIEAERMRAELKSYQEDLIHRQKEIEARKGEIEMQAQVVEERSRVAEEQRQNSLEILEGATKLRRASEKSLRDAEERQAEMEAERELFEQSRLKTEAKRAEYERELAEASRLRAEVAEEAERAQQVREEADREREVMAEELNQKMAEAARREEVAREQVSEIRNRLSEAETHLATSERERHELRAEVTRLQGVAADFELQSKELQEARQWMARNSELEDQIAELRQAKGIPNDNSAEKAEQSVQEISAALGKLEGGDPVKISRVRQILTDLMDVASGGGNMVEINTVRAKALIAELGEEQPEEAAEEDKTPKYFSATESTPAQEAPSGPTISTDNETPKYFSSATEEIPEPPSMPAVDEEVLIPEPPVPAPEPVVPEPPLPTPDPVVPEPPVPAPDPVVPEPPVPAPEPVIPEPPVPAPDPVVPEPPVPTYEQPDVPPVEDVISVEPAPETYVPLPPPPPSSETFIPPVPAEPVVPAPDPYVPPVPAEPVIPDAPATIDDVAAIVEEIAPEEALEGFDDLENHGA